MEMSSRYYYKPYMEWEKGIDNREASTRRVERQESSKVQCIPTDIDARKDPFEQNTAENIVGV